MRRPRCSCWPRPTATRHGATPQGRSGTGGTTRLGPARRGRARPRRLRRPRRPTGCCLHRAPRPWSRHGARGGATSRSGRPRRRTPLRCTGHLPRPSAEGRWRPSGRAHSACRQHRRPPHPGHQPRASAALPWCGLRWLRLRGCCQHRQHQGDATTASAGAPTPSSRPSPPPGRRPGHRCSAVARASASSHQLRRGCSRVPRGPRGGARRLRHPGALPATTTDPVGPA